MKKLILQFLIFGFTFSMLHGSLIDVYKKGTVKIVASQDFGIGQDWETIFYDLNKKMVIAPDGSIFVSNSRQHNIFKFDRNGKKIMQFSQKGRGPGDCVYPGDMDILDGKYLTLDEYPLDFKISIFDFSGKCIKVLKTQNSVFDHCAIKNNKIAYITWKQTKSPNQSERRVIIKDVLTGVEKTVFSATVYMAAFIEIDKSFVVGINPGEKASNVFIRQTIDGNLLVGVSNSPEIRIFSPGGKLIKSFSLNINPVPVTSDFIKRYKDANIKEMEEEEAQKPSGDKRIINAYKKYDFAKLFEKNFPYYGNIHVDGEGNILFFKNMDCIDHCPAVFQVYSPEGKYICECRVDEGSFELSSISNIKFTSHGIYTLCQVKGSDDISLRLVKVKFN